jgi:hypothetical protein
MPKISSQLTGNLEAGMRRATPFPPRRPQGEVAAVGPSLARNRAPASRTKSRFPEFPVDFRFPISILCLPDNSVTWDLRRIAATLKTAKKLPGLSREKPLRRVLRSGFFSTRPRRRDGE